MPSIDVDRAVAPPSSGRLPAPLSDPLRAIRKFLAMWLGIEVVLTVVGFSVFRTLAPRMLEPDTLDQSTWEAIAWSRSWACHFIRLPLLIFVIRCLPGRATDAFYLRPFRKDRRTLAIRKALQAGLGSGFRLSGIRDPHRRWPFLVRAGFFLYLAVACILYWAECGSLRERAITSVWLAVLFLIYTPAALDMLAIARGTDSSEGMPPGRRAIPRCGGFGSVPIDVLPVPRRCPYHLESSCPALDPTARFRFRGDEGFKDMSARVSWRRGIHQPWDSEDRRPVPTVADGRDADGRSRPDRPRTTQIVGAGPCRMR